MNNRYAVAPQMKVYDELPMVLQPYMIMGSQPNYRSGIVNTDNLGFRRSHIAKRYDSIILGSSFVFGVGASSDDHTIVSILNKITNYSFRNLGIRAANSTQELIAALPYLATTKCVIICSGLNNLIVNRNSGIRSVYSSFFYDGIFDELSRYPVPDLASRMRNPELHISFVILIGEIIRRSLRISPPSRPEDIRRSHRTKWVESESDIIDIAVHMQMRDLNIIRRSVSEECKIVFALQPYRKVDTLWDKYRRQIKADIYLDDDMGDADCWVDDAHMTDKGYAQVAERIAKYVD